jgi:hypothetical protein
VTVREQASLLLGDANSERSSKIKSLLERDFFVDVRQCETFSDLRSHLATGETIESQRVMIADDLPYSKAERGGSTVLRRILDVLIDARSSLRPGLLYTREPDIPRDLRNLVDLIEFPSSGFAEAHTEELLNVAGVWFRDFRRSLRKVDLVDSEEQATLEEMVRSLDDDRDLNAAKDLLTRLSSRFFKAESATVGKLAPGLSGARVFRVRPMGAADATEPAKEFVLKLSKSSESWKLKEEVNRLKQVRECDPPKREHSPTSHPPLYPDKDWEGGATELGWSAICYEFLGGEEYGTLIDLRNALITSASTLVGHSKGAKLKPLDATAANADEFRAKCLQIVLDWLRGEWCGKFSQPATAKLWSAETLPNQKYPEKSPPYQLSAGTKSAILGFLANPDQAQLGSRMIADWEARRKAVWEFTGRANGETGIKLLDTEIPLIQAPVHGDLNGNNVFIWLTQPDHPFLIDFPMFQRWGHALQDFARLEVELKYALMDRQEDSPAEQLPALDLTPAQFPLWCALEDFLLAKTRKPTHLPTVEAAYPENVRLTLTLVRAIREAACQVHDSRKRVKNTDPSFLDEYLPALLFHTLKAVSYTTLSPFKRLLAVYSAAGILENLRTRTR